MGVHLKFPKFLSNLFNSYMQNGIDTSTPPHLVDRIVFSNWVCLVATFVNLIGAQANFQNGYNLLLVINGYYQAAIILTWILNRFQYHLTARLTFLFALYSGIIFSCAIQGPAYQMEFYLLPLAVLSMTLFHPTERYWAWLFVLISLFAFHFFVRQSGPILNIDPAHGRYTLEDLRTNQINYTLALVLTLIALSNAYFRASKLVDDQRSQTFNQTRLSNLGLISCNVAHELNSPLAALNLQSFRLQEKLKKAGAPAEQLEDTSRLLKLSDRLSSVVQSFKLLSNQTDTENMQVTKLESLFKLTKDLSAERLKRYGIVLQFDFHDSEDPVFCQPVAISQALFYIVDNAIDAISENPGNRWIRIQSQPFAKRLRIQVTDSGLTPDRKTASRIFDPFFTTKALGRGVGIGLTIARQIFESHGGSIQLDSTSPNTSFVVELPRART